MSIIAHQSSSFVEHFLHIEYFPLLVKMQLLLQLLTSLSQILTFQPHLFKLLFNIKVPASEQLILFPQFEQILF